MVKWEKGEGKGKLKDKGEKWQGLNGRWEREKGKLKDKGEKWQWLNGS